MLRFAVVLMPLAFLARSGSDGEQGPPGESPEITVTDANEAQCPEGGSVVEIESAGETEEFVVCSGADGAAGETGPQGPSGEPVASDASVGRIEASIFCTGILADTVINATQNAVVFGDGSIWAYGSVDDGIEHASSTSFYAPTQLGAGRASVIIASDIQGPTVDGFWTLGFDVSTLNSIVEYRDIDVAGGILFGRSRRARAY